MSPTKTQTLQPIPYLSFDGNCAEAMHFLLAATRGVSSSTDVIHRTTLDLEIQTSTFAALSENLSRLRGVGATNTAGLVVDGRVARR